MKILVIFLLLSLSATAQTDIEMSKDPKIDTILNQITKTTEDHSNLAGKLLQVMYDGKVSDLVNITRKVGFTGLYYLNEYDGTNYSDERLLETSDTTLQNRFCHFIENLPTDRGEVRIEIKSTKGIDMMLFEEYTYMLGGKTYFIRFVFINSQITGILINIHGRY
jgi:hypothetical protein